MARESGEEPPSSRDERRPRDDDYDRPSSRDDRRPRDDDRPSSRDDRRPRDDDYERPRSRDGYDRERPRSRDDRYYERDEYDRGRRSRDDDRYRDYERRRRDDDRYERSRRDYDRDDDRYYDRDRGYDRERGYDRRGERGYDRRDDRRHRSRSRGDRHRRRREREDPAWTARDDRVVPRGAARTEPESPRPRSRSRRDDRPPPREPEPREPEPAPVDKEERRSRSLSWSPPPAVRRQMAELKARKAREAEAAKAGKDPSEKTGKFWDGFRWVEHTPASQLPSNPATRKERRLYVGNLPQTFDGEQLRIFLNEALRACGAIPAGVDEVVVSSWVSPDKKFAFVELSTVEASTTALGLSGITCMGCQLKICHPNNYVVGALPGMGTALATTDQNGAAYAPGFGPDADPQQQEFMQAALAAMASGAPT